MENRCKYFEAVFTSTSPFVKRVMEFMRELFYVQILAWMVGLAGLIFSLLHKTASKLWF